MENSHEANEIILRSRQMMLPSWTESLLELKDDAHNLNNLLSSQVNIVRHKSVAPATQPQTLLQNSFPFRASHLNRDSFSPGEVTSCRVFTIMIWWLMIAMKREKM